MCVCVHVGVMVMTGQDMPWSSSETTASVVKESEDDLEECVKVRGLFNIDR